MDPKLLMLPDTASTGAGRRPPVIRNNEHFFGSNCLLFSTTKCHLLQKVSFKTIQCNATADDDESFSAAILRVSELKFKPGVLHSALFPHLPNHGDGDGDGEFL